MTTERLPHLVRIVAAIQFRSFLFQVSRAVSLTCSACHARTLTEEIPTLNPVALGGWRVHQQRAREYGQMAPDTSYDHAMAIMLWSRNNNAEIHLPNLFEHLEKAQCLEASSQNRGGL